MRMRVVISALICVFLAAPLLAQGPPPSSGPTVVRYERDGEAEDYWWVYTDWKRGYVAFHGVDIVSWCEWEQPGDPIDGYNFWDVQEVSPAAHEGWIHALEKADDVTTSVWPVTIWDGNACVNILFNSAPIATGTVDIISNDNDVDAWIDERPSVNTYKVSGHGVLTAADGERMRFNGGLNCVWGGITEDPVDDDYFAGEHCSAKIILR